MRSAFLLLLAVGIPAQSDRPNILLFLVDDLGWQDLSQSFHTEKTPFNRRYRTPNVERLAALGVRFTNGYASAPICSPTRTSLMTGMSPGRSHITYWTLWKDKDQSARHAKVRAPRWNMNALQEGDVTLPRLLQGSGYRTIHAGKAHLGAKGTSGENPTNLGFDVNIAGHAAGGPGSFLGKENFSARHRRGSNVWDVPGLEAYHGKDIFLTEAITLEARKALRAVKDDRPFFLHFAPYAVHAPITANPRLVNKYRHLHPKEAAYASMIETYDNALGDLLGEIEAMGRSKNTIVIFTSDNGGLSAHARGGEKHTHNRPLRSGKGSAYEGGVRVPWIVHWPGVTRAGTVSDQIVVTHDLFPSICAMAGVTIPEAHRTVVDGRDLAPVLGGGSWTDERPVFWNVPHFWGVHGPGINPYTGMRAGRWKLLYFHGSRSLELYDLAEDLGETTNVAGRHPKVRKRLTERMSRWCEQVSAQMSIDVETGKPVPLPRRL